VAGRVTLRPPEECRVSVFQDVRQEKNLGFLRIWILLKEVSITVNC